MTGGVGPQAKTFDKLLCNKLLYKKRQKYSNIIHYHRCKLSFLIRKMILLCQGPRHEFCAGGGGKGSGGEAPVGSRAGSSRTAPVGG